MHLSLLDCRHINGAVRAAETRGLRRQGERSAMTVICNQVPSSFAFSKPDRTFPKCRFEVFHEVTDVVKAGVRGNFLNAKTGIQQQLTGPMQAHQLNVTRKGHTRLLLEKMSKSRERDIQSVRHVVRARIRA